MGSQSLLRPARQETGHGRNDVDAVAAAGLRRPLRRGRPRLRKCGDASLWAQEELTGRQGRLSTVCTESFRTSESQMTAAKRLGFVGVGNMGQCAHLLNYTDLEGCEVVALAEVRPDLAARVAARYGVPKVYADHRQMLAAEALDGIVAAQPFSRHGVLLPELYDTGIPVLSEKPLARSVQVGQELVAAGGVHVLGYHKRSDPAVLHAVERIRQLRQSAELGPMR
ncbi:MAG TPA: hypothetical protein DGN59_01385, partial [Candidatus Latescibacteria bacterium]|nr:hypothetical protein [Candidatus Latescibacterota bacterium]